MATTEAIAGEPSLSSTTSGTWGADYAQALAWPLVILIALLLFRKQITTIFKGFSDRLGSGVAIKLGSFEVGAVDVSKVTLGSAGGEARKDDDGARTKERFDYYARCRSVLVVHRLAHSTLDGQLFDVLVYLIPHEDKGTLASVQKVEYFLGDFWKRVIYTSTNRAAGFPFRLSAYGPTLCTAKIHFTDGETFMAHRYLDFEMGGFAPRQKEST